MKSKEQIKSLQTVPNHDTMKYNKKGLKMNNLFLNISFDISEDEFLYSTNIKETEIPEIIETFLRSQIGKGADNSEPNKNEIYNINFEIDLSFDNIKCNSNCGNFGLRDGILLHFLKEEFKNGLYQSQE